MNHRTRALRRIAASVTFAAVAGGLALPVLVAPAAHAVEETETRRLEGGDRYETAAAVALDTFPDGADTVIVATGEDFADALAANGLAGAVGAPILLTPTDSLHEATAGALADLAPDTVLVMGGDAAVSQAVEDELAEGYTVERVEGEDRFETAAAAGAAIAATAGALPVTDGGVGTTSEGVTAVLTNGFDFPDAVSGGPVAFAGRLPVLLTEAGSLPAATTTALDELGIEHVILLGGSAVISEAVRGELEDAGYSTERLGGADRYATNTAVNTFAQAEPGYEFGGSTVYLSTGTGFADALAAGPAAGAAASPLVLTSPTALSDAAAAYFQANGNVVDAIVAIGGPSAVPDDVVAAAAAAARVDDNAAFAVAPAAAAVVTQSSIGNSDGAREFTVTGLEPAAEYVIALLDAETVEPGDPDTFTGYSVSDDASTSIDSVNGTPAGLMAAVQTTAAADEEGAIVFTVDATAHDDVYPVVYEDADGDGELTTVNGRAAEPYGLGGRTTWVPPEAESNASGESYEGLVVLAHDDDLGYFIAEVPTDPALPGLPGAGEERTFHFDRTDRFRVEGETVTPTTFATRLTDGDTVTATYFQDLQSLFDITTDAGTQVNGLEQGTTVADNAGLEYLNGGDVLLLHFSEPVNVSSSASITVRGLDDDGDLTELALTNGTTMSSWSVSGSTVTITVGAGADATEINYDDTEITDLTGVTAIGGSAVTEAHLEDRLLEDDGPELMAGTSTCTAGDTSCTVSFNEPVDPDEAGLDRYTYDGAATLANASVGDDARTVTFTFLGGVEAGDEIRPTGDDDAATDDDVHDDDGQPSTQTPIVFVS